MILGASTGFRSRAGSCAGRILALLLTATVACTASADEPPAVTVVLFDVSNSTLDAGVRARYQETLAMILAHLREAGGVLGADVIDDNPLVHGSLPINERFAPCTVFDNSLDCAREQDAQQARVQDRAAAILQTSARGTDVFGALALVEQFLSAYPEARDRTLVICSDMIQSADGIHLGAVEEWTETEIAGLLARAPSVDLSGVRVYVVGAGATTLAKMSSAQVQGLQRFWTLWFERAGAEVVFYGANLPRYPIGGSG